MKHKNKVKVGKNTIVIVQCSVRLPKNLCTLILRYLKYGIIPIKLQLELILLCLVFEKLSDIERRLFPARLPDELLFLHQVLQLFRPCKAGNQSAIKKIKTINKITD